MLHLYLYSAYLLLYSCHGLHSSKLYVVFVIIDHSFC